MFKKCRVYRFICYDDQFDISNLKNSLFINTDIVDYLNNDLILHIIIVFLLLLLIYSLLSNLLKKLKLN